jgi:signal transduction histidine kinase
MSDLVGRLEREGIATGCDVPEDLVLPEPIEALLFRAAREALQNVRKHAGASHVDVSVRRRDDDVVLSVADDGRGFDPAEPPEGEVPHLGLELISDLAQEAGGRVQVDAIPGRGTRVRVEVPVA